MGAVVFGRDSLAFATIQLLHPLDIIETYQQAIHPDHAPRGD